MIRLSVGYGDLMNLYGDCANVSALARYLEDIGEKVERTEFSVGSYEDLEQTDLLFIGSGTEKSLLEAQIDLRRFWDALSAYIERGKMLLLTGNAMLLLGRGVTDTDGVCREGPGFLRLSGTLLRKTSYSEHILRTDLAERPVLGVINSRMRVETEEEPWFTLLAGQPFEAGRKTEGVRRGNLFATKLSGPLLLRNPFLLPVFSELLLDRKLPENREQWFAYAKAGYEQALSLFSTSLHYKQGKETV